MQRDAQQHGECPQGIEIVPAFGDQGGEFDGAGHGGVRSLVIQEMMKIQTTPITTGKRGEFQVL